MSHQVAFLFGAGASALAMPTVSNLHVRLKTFLGELQANQVVKSRSAGFVPHDTKNRLQEQLIGDVDWLYKELTREEIQDDGKPKDVLRHASIDTLAKIYFIRGDTSSLDRLKIVLSLFFVYEQVVKGFDIRYDGFFASIISRNAHKLPSTIRIATWNYDSQFELAFGAIVNETDHRKIQELLRVVNKQLEKPEIDGFALFRLNGSTNFCHSKTRKHRIILREDHRIDNIENVLDGFGLSKHPQDTPFPLLSFAWEEDYTTPMDRKSIVDLAAEALANTSVLVVIGYSFPFFNREVDEQVLSAMKGLKKVYVQDKNPGPVIGRINAIRDVPCEQVPGTDQFYLPHELRL